MSALSAADWLGTWEDSLVLPPALRPCALLAPLLPGGMQAAERLSIGELDACLLDLYAALFGPQLNATANCPVCGEHQEFSMGVNDLQQSTAAGNEKSFEWRDADMKVSFRLPNSLDLAAISGARTLEEGERLLLQRCCVTSCLDDRPLDFEDLPATAAEALTEAMAAADPQALIELALTCPVCDHHWDEPLDIGAYLQESLGCWAEQLLNQVHVLAGAYGWSEKEILSLSPSRRARYLARILA